MPCAAPDVHGAADAGAPPSATRPSAAQAAPRAIPLTRVIVHTPGPACGATARVASGRARSVLPTRARTGIERCLPTSRGDLDDRPRHRQAHRMLDLARGPNEHLIGQSGSRHELGTPALVLD